MLVACIVKAAMTALTYRCSFDPADFCLQNNNNTITDPKKSMTSLLIPVLFVFDFVCF